MRKKLCILMAIVAFCTWASPGYKNHFAQETQPVQRKPDISRVILPDLVLEKIEVTSEPSGNDKVKLTVSYWIFNNSSADSRCCPTEEGTKNWEENPAMNLLYNTRLEARSYPNGRFLRIGGTGTETKANERQKYTEVHYVKKGTSWQCRATADFGNWIREKSEDNNQKTKVWPLRMKK